jgi:hypothetical protein
MANLLDDITAAMVSKPDDWATIKASALYPMLVILDTHFKQVDAQMNLINVQLNNINSQLTIINNKLKI